jgi:PAS domain S-box-containing protein
MRTPPSMRTHPLFDPIDDTPSERAYLRRFSLLVSANGFLYVLFGMVQRWASPQAVERAYERPLLYGFFTLLVLFANFAPLRHENRVRLVASNRPLYLAHYFSLIARNHVLATYALPGYFLVFFMASAYERPRNFFLFAAYAFTLAWFCESHDPVVTTTYFRCLFAVSLLSSYFVMLNRNRLLESVRRTEQLLKDVFASASVGLALLDMDGKIVSLNDALARLLGGEQNAFRGRALSSFAKNDGPELKEALVLVASSQRLHVLAEVPFLERDGRKPWGRVSLTRIFPRAHEALVLALVEDVTAQREGELLVRDRQDKMQYSARMAALGEMAGGIAHEINNPLAVIDLTARVLTERMAQQRATPEFIAESLASIQTMIWRITRIIGGLRRFSRDGSHDEPQDLPLLGVVQETLALCEESLRLRSIELKVDVPAGLRVHCRGVESSQVMLNVINNAVDALRDAPVRRISLRAVRFRPGFVALEIANTGPAVPEELAEKIFQPFFTTKPVGQGVGLGLSISLGMMSSQGGSLTLERRQGETCFVLQFREGQGEQVERGREQGTVRNPKRERTENR